MAYETLLYGRGPTQGGPEKNRGSKWGHNGAGFALETAFLWPYHYGLYWQSTQRIYRQEFDPDYEGLEENYNYADRINPAKNPQAEEIKNAVARVSLSGDIRKPLITLHGTLDTLFPITKDIDNATNLINSDKYAEEI